MPTFLIASSLHSRDLTDPTVVLEVFLTHACGTSPMLRAYIDQNAAMQFIVISIVFEIIMEGEKIIGYTAFSAALP